MNEIESSVIHKLSTITEQILAGKRKFNLDLGEVESIEVEKLKALANNVVTLAEQYRDCYGFIVDLSCGRLYSEPPRLNAFANPFKQLHSELRHLTWQIQQIADGDYDQCVSFSGDFSDSINKMIGALRERQELAELIKENENLFRSIFHTSPDGIVMCDLDHNIIHASKAAYNMLQITEQGEDKINFDDLVLLEDLVIFKGFIDSLLMEGKSTVFAEMRLVAKKTGKSFWSEQNASMLYDSNNEPKGYIIILRDISERKAAEAQLLQYMHELDESNRTKDKMFSIISHDLKSPFSALLGTSNMLMMETGKENVNMDRMKKFSKIINDSANRTFSLLINLLDWARMQSNRIEINPTFFDLSEIITENVSISQTMATNKNITLTYDTPGNYPIVSDKAIINTILRNLISNALKYTPQQGEVTVSLSFANDMYMISVKDTGVGIPPEQLEKLFKSASIQSTPGTNNEQGTGLGLDLCKDFVNKIGGDIWVTSDYGHGATFTFTLKDLG